MAFQLKRRVALEVATNQVEALITMPRHRNTVWTQQSLYEYLKGLGLDYTLDEVSKLNDELHRRGIVEDV